MIKIVLTFSFFFLMTHLLHAQKGKDLRVSCVIIENKAILNDKTIYPNPAKDFVNIKTLPNSVVKIYNTEGIVMKVFDNVFGESYIDVRDLNKGMYYVRVFEPDTTLITGGLEIK